MWGMRQKEWTHDPGWKVTRGALEKMPKQQDLVLGGGNLHRYMFNEYQFGNHEYLATLATLAVLIS